ncbi:HlyD family secretion protein [Aquihabitans sp. G128]|uniref:HlyD family efflux transporter periplasmic adaptor subunit n=1 Tax=Aquihabitans sp. G128 TaxID=2849779 RepID=UPI001C22E0FE|nr:HlyD family secretion protein [Aquihabitans sp. G128]QXC62973.1 HlyD family secretion protein [Aquihabitans sp. G128]
MSQYDDELRAMLAEGRRLEGGRSEAPTPMQARRWADDWKGRGEEFDDVEPGRDLNGLRGRPTRTLQSMWIDPEETPFTPVQRPGRAIPARLFSLLVLAVFVGLLAWLIVPEVSFRLANVNNVTVRDGVLTAQPVPLAPPVAATVEKLFVDAGHLPSGVLPAGTPIARLRSAGADADGSSTVDLTAPFDARFVSVDTLEGAVTLPGTPVATVYDPTKMYVVMTVRPEVLESLRRGMKARLTSRVLSEPIEGTVVAAVPLLGTDQNPTTSELVNIRIQPDGESVVDLVPGLRFDATIDLKSAPRGAQPLVITAADTAG